MQKNTFSHYTPPAPRAASARRGLLFVHTESVDRPAKKVSGMQAAPRLRRGRATQGATQDYKGFFAARGVRAPTDEKESAAPPRPGREERQKDKQTK